MYYYELGAISLMIVSFVSFTAYCIYKTKMNEIIDLSKRFDDI